MNALSKDIYMYILGVIVIFALISVVILMIFHAVPTENKDMLNIVLGALVMMASAVINYFFGSSKGSADKTEMMNSTKDQLLTTNKQMSVSNAAN